MTQIGVCGPLLGGWFHGSKASAGLALERSSSDASTLAVLMELLYVLQ